MSTLVAFDGIARTYHYGRLNPEIEIPGFIGGNFILARDGTPPEVIYVGQAASIYQALTETQLWPRAKAEFGADAIYMHRELDERKRMAEQADIAQRHQPPMNLAEDESALPK